MPDIRNPPPMAETLAFLRNAPPPGEYSRTETERREAERALKRGINLAFCLPDEVPFKRSRPVAAPRRTRRTGRPPASTYCGEPCGYCERPMLGVRSPTREHKHPRSLGGTLSHKNRLIVCAPCNHEKADRTLEQFMRYLAIKNDPRAPIVRKHLSGNAEP